MSCLDLWLRAFSMPQIDPNAEGSIYSGGVKCLFKVVVLLLKYWNRHTVELVLLINTYYPLLRLNCVSPRINSLNDCQYKLMGYEGRVGMWLCQNNGLYKKQQLEKWRRKNWKRICFGFFRVQLYFLPHCFHLYLILNVW